jgi:hypothetical protein
MKLIRATKVAALVGAVVGAALVAAPQASAANISGMTIVTPEAFAAGGTIAPPTLPAKPTIKRDIVPSATSDHCSTILPHLKDYAARGIKQVACETTKRTASAPSAHTGTGSVTPNAFPAACANNAWVIIRTEECNLNSVHPWLAISTDTGAIVGTMTYLISQDIRLSTTTSTITESITFDYAAATGAPAGLPTTVVWTSACSSPCGVTSIRTLAFTVPPGQSRTFTVTYRDNPLAQAPDTFSTSYIYDVQLPGFLPSTGPDTWRSPAPIRCDNNTPGFTNTGCVVPSYVPAVALPLSVYGAAAMNAYVGEVYLPGTPGLTDSTPLTRGNPANTDANRAVTCRGFQPLPPGNSYGVVSDSCDEYPFASSQQSGGAIGLDGSNCLQIVPKQDSNGRWTRVDLNIYTNAYPQLCVRGHVNSILNSNVGSRALNPMYTLNRMMIGDRYTVQVTQ